MLKIILTLLASMSLMGCVISPDGYTNSGVGVGVGADVSVGNIPSIHTSTNFGLTVRLHPDFVVADAYLVAQQHCSRFGTFARPIRDWDIYTNQVRFLDYTCVSRRPVLAFPHIIVNHSRWYNRPWHRSWYNRRFGRRYTPGRSYNPRPIRNGWWTKRPVVGKRPSVTRPRSSRPSVTNPRGTYTPRSSKPNNGWWSKKNRKGTYTPKPTRNRNAWGGINKKFPIKSKYSKKSYKSKTYTSSKPNKWSYKTKPYKSTKAKSKWTKVSKKVSTKKAYNKPVKTKTKVYTAKKTVVKPSKKKSFSTNKVKKFEKKKVSKKKSYVL